MVKTNKKAPPQHDYENPHPLHESKTAFGSEPVLGPGMSKRDYFELRDKWYKKVQKRGHSELERFNEHNKALVSSYLHRTTQQSAHKAQNYNVIDYYDHLSTFELQLDYIKQSKQVQLKYKINRFFHQRQPRNGASLYVSDRINFSLNRFILRAIIAGASLESISRLLGQDKPIKNQADVARLSQISTDQRILKHTKGQNKNKLWQRIRLIHECAWQYLVLSGQVSAQDLYSMDLLGLDNPVLNKFIEEQLGVEVRPKSIASRYSIHIY